MRPHSEIRIDLDAALVDGGGTTRQLAQRTGWSIGLVREALNNMARGPRAQVTKRYVRVAGVKRPVPFYERLQPAEAAQRDAQADQPFLALMAAWQRPVAVAGVRAM